ncbi:hypothetical protein BDN72DRAFT_502403 [Pluteus cervinus]|uniref:Uncharacterized protein n=1 Tax=Pluteus cervinus TaxID=181527 RepID=A0ACD3AYI1_9AGAR|nr:hypothetical protein BDN72DRAFT_502403 [Pluteus cervinus]
MWKRPITSVKCIFFFTRYFAYGFQLCNQYLVTVPFTHSGTKHTACLRWFAFQTAGIQTQLWMLEIIILLRVCALYHQSHAVRVTLSLIFVLQIAVVVYAAIETFKDLSFNQYCMPTHTPKATIWFSLRTFVMHAIFAGLTFAKRGAAIRDGWSTAPLFVLVTRDGIWVSAAIVCLVVIAIAALFSRAVVQLIFSWQFTILTICACRLVLNMQKLALNTGSESSLRSTPSPILTADFDIRTDFTHDFTISYHPSTGE